MAIKLTDPFNDASDLTIVQDSNVAVAVASNYVVCTVTTGGATNNGAYANSQHTVSAGDRLYYSAKDTRLTGVGNNGSMGSERVGAVPVGTYFEAANYSTTNIRAVIWGSNFGTPFAYVNDTEYYFLIVHDTNTIDVYYKTGGHSDTIGDYTLLGELSGGDEIGQSVNWYGSISGLQPGQITKFGPYAFTDSNGLTPPDPTLTSATGVSGTQIDLVLTDNGDSVSEAGISVERSTSDNLHYAEIDTIAVGSSSYADNTCSAGVTYYYRLRSYVDFNGVRYYSGYSAEKSATANDPTPSDPTDLTASTNDPENITISFTNNGDETNQTSIEVQTNVCGSAGWTHYSDLAATATGATLGPFTNGRNIDVRVRSVWTDGVTTEYSNWSNVATGTVTFLTPDQLTVTATSPHTVQLDWFDEASAVEDGYEIYKKIGAGSYFLADHITVDQEDPDGFFHWTDVTVVPDTLYTYKVRAYGNFCTGQDPIYSDYSTEASDTTPSASTLPKGGSGLLQNLMQILAA